MKATIEFNLPEEKKELACCMKATDMAAVLFEIQYNLKKRLEARIEAIDKYEALDLVFESFSELLDEHGVVVNDIIY